MMYCFDLDGCLVDTQALLREAYIRSGVTPPLDFFGRPAKDWLPQADPGAKSWKYSRRNKNNWYELLAREHGVKLLPAGECAVILREHLSSQGIDTTSRFLVITGASKAGAQTALQYSGLSWMTVLQMECNKQDKVKALLALPPGTVYVDDNDIDGPEIAVASYCDYVNPNGKTAQELFLEIVKKEEA